MKDRIKKIRKELDLTQQKFADRIGVKQNTIAQYEMGRNVPIDSVISLICREFKVNEQWLRDGTGEMFMEQTRDEQISAFMDSIQASADDSFKKRFVSMLSALDESEWGVLEKMALTLHQGNGGQEIAGNEDAPAAQMQHTGTGASDLRGLSIDEKVARYRAELEREKKAEEGSEAS